METNKRLVLFIAMLLSCACMRAEGEVAFSIEAFDIMPGETKEVSLNMANTAIVQIFNGAIQMSEGLSFVSEYDEEDEADMPVHRTDRLHTKHEVGFSLKSANSLTFLIHSGTTRRDIAVGEGAVITFKVKADESMALGKAQIKVSRLSAANSDNVELCSVKEFTTDVNVYKPIIEDEKGNKYVSNGDESVDLYEVVQEPDGNGVISIPATVKDGNKDLTVTGIVSSAFEKVDKSRISAIDLSSTGVTNLTVDRSNGIFKGFTEGTLIILPTGTGNQAAAGEKNIVIGGLCDELVLKEDMDFNTPIAFHVKHAVFDREFASNVTATVYLPFTIPGSLATGLGTFHSFKEIDTDGNAVFNDAETGEIQSYVPYIFIPSTTKIDITDDEYGIAVSVASSTVGTNGELVGTTEEKTWTEAPGNIYGFAAAAQDGADIGDFVKVGAGASIERYRAYLVIESTSAARISVVIDDSQTSGIKSRTAITSASDGEWYSIDGRKQNGTPTKKGIYIRNGLKVIIK